QSIESLTNRHFPLRGQRYTKADGHQAMAAQRLVDLHRVQARSFGTIWLGRFPPTRRSVKHGELTMGMMGYAKAGGEMARIFCLLTATVGVLAILSVSAKSVDDIKPPVDYRRGFHVNPMIATMAGH